MGNCGQKQINEDFLHIIEAQQRIVNIISAQETRLDLHQTRIDSLYKLIGPDTIKQIKLFDHLKNISQSIEITTDIFINKFNIDIDDIDIEQLEHLLIGINTADIPKGLDQRIYWDKFKEIIIKIRHILDRDQLFSKLHYTISPLRINTLSDSIKHYQDGDLTIHLYKLGITITVKSCRPPVCMCTPGLSTSVCFRHSCNCNGIKDIVSIYKSPHTGDFTIRLIGYINLRTITEYQLRQPLCKIPGNITPISNIEYIQNGHIFVPSQKICDILKLKSNRVKPVIGLPE